MLDLQGSCLPLKITSGRRSPLGHGLRPPCLPSLRWERASPRGSRWTIAVLCCIRDELR